MQICKQEEPERRQPATAFMVAQVPAVQSVMPADENAAEEAQWEACLAELTRHQYGESAAGCDWTDGAMAREGCHW